MSQYKSRFILFASLVAVLGILVAGLPYGSFSWFSVRNTVGAQYEPAGEPAEPGCSITEEAVVGKIFGDTMSYYEPRLTASTGVVLKAGTTAWVLGEDETGQFFSLCYAGTYLWVPVQAMGSNPDKVWQNTPLPTLIVEIIDQIVSYLQSLLP